MSGSEMRNNVHGGSDDVACGRKVIFQEVEGLKAMAEALDDRFTAAVECLYGLKGRVVVSGIGKSGHIARKIAATFASTGTPATFVHPGEASHGDLGMVTRDDVVIVLSNSGETAELRDIIAYAKRFAIPLIAMVRRKSSMLVEAADIALVLPEISEASPTGAPTTSTTMMLALGDALAIALLEKRGFTADDFNLLHPGGTLGKRFMQVKDLMHGVEGLPLVTSADNMSEVLLVMTAGCFGCAGVVDASGKLTGIITDGDLRRHIDSSMLERTAEEIMTKDPITINGNMLAVEALRIMNDKSVTSLFAVEGNNTPVGILHIHDCLRAGIA